MWPFRKKKKEDDEGDDEDESSEKEEDSGASSKIEMIQAQLTKINGSLQALNEARKSTAERFATNNQQMGELRGQITDLQRTVGTIEVKATKAADLVESVHPDKLMVEVQKVDGKVEGLRGILEAKEEMMKNLMDQTKKIRDQVNLFKGIEQVLKLNAEVKDELMRVKKIVANVERHADRVDNVFIEAQKSFDAFNRFSDKLDSQQGELKELKTKIDKVEGITPAFLKKKEFDDKISKIEKSDKKAKNVLEDIIKYKEAIEGRFKKLEGELRGEFDLKLEKAEIFSSSFEQLLKENPMFAQGLKLDEYLKARLESESVSPPQKPPEKNGEEEGSEEGSEEGGDSGSEGESKE